MPYGHSKSIIIHTIPLKDGREKYSADTHVYTESYNVFLPRENFHFV